mmetsp:Transcript_18809/g.21575  ORF Transcript_18809/g.21575 Transcript_18809/m.21575 type:complete len:137 (-) Transcript_18809:5-415(-)
MSSSSSRVPPVQHPTAAVNTEDLTLLGSVGMIFKLQHNRVTSRDVFEHIPCCTYYSTTTLPTQPREKKSKETNRSLAPQKKRCYYFSIFKMKLYGSCMSFHGNGTASLFLIIVLMSSLSLVSDTCIHTQSSTDVTN